MTIRIPTIEEVPIKIKELKFKDKFRHRFNDEFMFLEISQWKRFTAVCYKGSQAGASTPGGIYGFDPEAEVIWLKEVYEDKT